MKTKLILVVMILLFLLGIGSCSGKGQEDDEGRPLPDNILSNEQLLEKYSSYCTKAGFQWEIIQQHLPVTVIDDKKYEQSYDCWVANIYNQQLISVTLNITNGNLVSFLKYVDSRQNIQTMGDNPKQLQVKTLQKAEEYILKFSSEKVEDLVLVKTQFGKWHNYWEFEWRKKYGKYLSHDQIKVVVSPDLNLISFGNYLITTSPRILDAKISQEAIEQLAREYAQLFFNEFSKGRESLRKLELPIKNKPRTIKLEVFHPNHISNNYGNYLANIKNTARLKESNLVWEVFFLEKAGVFIRIWIDAITGKLLGVEFG